MRHYQAVVGTHAIFSLDKNAFSDPSRALSTRRAPLAFIRYWSAIYSPDRIQDYTPRDLYIASGAHVAATTRTPRQPFSSRFSRDKPPRACRTPSRAVPAGLLSASSSDDEGRRTMFAKRFAVDTAFRLSRTLCSVIGISVNFVSVRGHEHIYN